MRCMAAGEERTLSVADATVEEGAQLAFRVSLNEAADWEVSVKYLTRNYTATAGADYEDVSGDAPLRRRRDGEDGDGGDSGRCG